MNGNATTAPINNSVVEATANTENEKPPDSSFKKIKIREMKLKTSSALFSLRQIILLNKYPMKF